MTPPIPGRRRRPAILVGLPIALGLVAAGILFARSWSAGREVTLGRRWPGVDLVSMDAIDHRAWDALLRRHVDGAGRVDYAAWKRSAADLQALDGYLDGLSRAGPGLPAARGTASAYQTCCRDRTCVR